MAAKSRTAIYYQTHPKARAKRQAYQADYNKRPAQAKRRAALNKYNREATKAGRNRVGDGTDAVHRGSKIVGYQKASTNRGSKSAAPGDRRARDPRYRPGGKKK